MHINFHTEEIEFELKQSNAIEEWLKSVIKAEESTLGELNYIFCSDEYLYKMNVEYLQHDTYTDVITFQYAEEVVHGDVFISIDRIHDNAAHFDVTIEEELSRVLVHGLLHLLGYKDKTEIEQTEMTSKENYYLKQKEALKDN
jgi:rRNA maturation RNase YbeY